MSATIQSLGVSVAGQVVRKYDRTEDRTTFVVDEGQARELHDSLVPILAFFDKQPPAKGTEIVDATADKAK